MRIPLKGKSCPKLPRGKRQMDRLDIPRTVFQTFSWRPRGRLQATGGALRRTAAALRRGACCTPRCLMKTADFGGRRSRGKGQEPRQHWRFGQEKTPTETGWGLGSGGGGGNRTRVRKPSAIGSTCLAQSIVFSLPPPDGQGDQSAIPLGFRGSGPDARHRDPM